MPDEGFRNVPYALDDFVSFVLLWGAINVFYGQWVPVVVAAGLGLGLIEAGAATWRRFGGPSPAGSPESSPPVPYTDGTTRCLLGRPTPLRVTVDATVCSHPAGSQTTGRGGWRGDRPDVPVTPDEK